MTKNLLVLVAIISTGILLGPVQYVSNTYADDIRSELIQIPEGENGVTVTGRISGYEIVDYKFYGCEAQDVIIVLETDNASSYFNILAPGESDVAMFIGIFCDKS